MLSLSAADVTKLKNLIRLAQELLKSVEPSGSKKSKPANSGKRTRRSGKELAAFRKMLKAERKKGVSAAELAEKHGVSSAYIYQLGT